MITALALEERQEGKKVRMVYHITSNRFHGKGHDKQSIFLGKILAGLAKVATNNSSMDCAVEEEETMFAKCVKQAKKRINYHKKRIDHARDCIDKYSDKSPTSHGMRITWLVLFQLG